MISPKLTENIRRIFEEENRRIVFWNDADGEFEDALDKLDLPGVSLLHLGKTGPLAAKVLLEIEDTTGKYLVYSPCPEPATEDDWLADIRLYSRPFRADQASMMLGELGLANHALRTHLGRYPAFFKSQERLQRLKKWVQPQDTEDDIDLKMIAVLAKAEQPNAFSILMRLFGEMAREINQASLIPTGAWVDIEKHGLANSFWKLMAGTFGYAETNSALNDLLIRLLVTDFARGLKGECPASLRHFLLGERSLALNASVFLSQWRNHGSHYDCYNGLSGQLAKALKIEDQISALDEEALLDVMTFEIVERHIVRRLRDYLLSKEGFSLDAVMEVLRRRRDGHWTGPLARIGEKGYLYHIIYDAIETAGELLSFRAQNILGISYADAKAMYDAYAKELFRNDQLYRLFLEAADQVELRGWDILKDLRLAVEDCYSWYVDQVALAWGRFMEQGTGKGLIHHWSLPDIKNQQDFYASFVDPVLKSTPQTKVYVIISDAFRFEAAQELARDINGKYRLKADLESLLGVLPSYTGLGMAALLPHAALDYKVNANVDILVDQKPTAAIEQRAKILSSAQGTAIQAEDLLAMNKDQGREFVKPWRVIYIYHNRIDATGDAAVSESKVFDATRIAINDLSALLSFIINNLNGSLVMVTADHGFLYQEKVPEVADKSGLGTKPAGTLKAKKRYLLGTDLGEATKVWHGNTGVTAGTGSSLDFWIPKGANRFHFAGGARYIHGGAMLQEIVVPVMIVKELRGQAKEKSVIRRVEIAPLGSVNKVVNNVQRFEFIQTDAVSERVLPRKLSVSLRDGEELISNEVILTFDSKSSSMDDRKRTATITVKAGQYDKKQTYALVLRDVETKIEYLRIPMTIDLTFSNDF